MRTTNAIGTGTVNLTLNVPADWRSLIGRATGGRLSVGDVLRELIEAGAKVKNRTLWRELRISRVRYYGLKRIGSAALLALFVAGAIVQGGHKELRRAQQITRVRIVRTEII